MTAVKLRCIPELDVASLEVKPCDGKTLPLE